jgi:hypothetical protein
LTDNNNNNPDYIEYYLLNAWWGEDCWITACYCRSCGILADPEGDFSIFKVKNDFYCEKCYIEIQQQHMKRNNVKWGGYLYWESLQSNPNLK